MHCPKGHHTEQTWQRNRGDPGPSRGLPIAEGDCGDGGPSAKMPTSRGVSESSQAARGRAAVPGIPSPHHPSPLPRACPRQGGANPSPDERDSINQATGQFGLVGIRPGGAPSRREGVPDGTMACREPCHPRPGMRGRAQRHGRSATFRVVSTRWLGGKGEGRRWARHGYPMPGAGLGRGLQVPRRARRSVSRLNGWLGNAVVARSLGSMMRAVTWTVGRATANEPVQSPSRMVRTRKQRGIACSRSGPTAWAWSFMCSDSLSEEWVSLRARPRRVSRVELWSGEALLAAHDCCGSSPQPLCGRCPPATSTGEFAVSPGVMAEPSEALMGTGFSQGKPESDLKTVP
jgi:hypothetical protein